MSKYRIENVSGRRMLVVQGQKGQQLSEREFYAVATGQVPGLLRAELIGRGNVFKLGYDISGYISLREFLLAPINKATFITLIDNILNTVKGLQKAYYNRQYILFDINAVMIEPTTRRIGFVYVPITFYGTDTDLRSFLLAIAQNCFFTPHERNDYAQEYIRIVNDGINFSDFKLEEYIKKLSGDGANGEGEIKCLRCGSVVPPGVSYCPSCGTSIYTLDNVTPDKVYDPLKNTVKQPKADANVADVAKKAYIRRVKTGEQIRITTDSFIVGKEPRSCEYCVSDNSTISRCHAMIKHIGDNWFISDLNSTNNTYVNGTVIRPNTDTVLYNGTNIRLANEEFIFNLY